MKKPSARACMERVVAVVADHFGVAVDEVTAEATIDDLSGDSLDAVEIVMAVEECFDEYDLAIDYAAVEGVKTVGELAAVTARTLGVTG